ncbi:Rossmann-fold NAD(P)-binding domain-containing protein [Hyalangium gracile]|uniref:NAD(P)-dependent oxidoreductase n=1 Tax=Hyalangium gracile TaxID=394092 RepID=UPI001CCDCE3C|nr:NAD(P)-dependent oxidoreductase [Hyalangium gracile]
MSANTKKPVLIIGGAGLTGSQAARTLRRLQPELPITIGGRDIAKAQSLARELGGADSVKIDLERPDLGLPEGMAFSAVVVFVKDDTLHSMKYAQAKGIPYLSISTGAFELGPEVALYIHKPSSAPILMASHWLAGTATLPTLYFAREFQRIEAIEIGAVLDEQDIGGPAAQADFERQANATPNAMILVDGKWRWVGPEEAARTFKGVDGTEIQARAYSLFDGLSLAAATDARSVRCDFALRQSANHRPGEPFSTEFIIEIVGQLRDGRTARVRHELVHPGGQAPMTALGVAVGVERLLGLAGGPPVAPGLYLPESVIDPAYMVQRLKEFGAQFRRV